MNANPSSESPPGAQGQFEIDAIYIRARTTICIALAAGGVLSICCGCLLLLLGKSGSDESLIKIAGAELSGRGIGAVMMVSSVAGGLLAYLAAPKYGRMRNVEHRRDGRTGATESWEISASTAIPFPPPTKRKPRSPRR